MVQVVGRPTVRTPASRPILLAAASAVALVACEQIIGFPDDILAGTGGSGGMGTTHSASSAKSSSSAGGASSSVSTSSTSGTGGTGGAGGGTGGGSCTSGDTRACYDGPAGTRNIGAC